MAIVFRSVQAYADAEAFDTMDSDFRNDNRVDTDYYFRAYARNSDFDDDRIGNSDGDSGRDDGERADEMTDRNPQYRENSNLGHVDGPSLARPICPGPTEQRPAVTIGNMVISGITLCSCPAGTYFDGDCTITEFGNCLYFLQSYIPSGHCRPQEHGSAKEDGLGLESKKLHDSSSAGNNGPSIKKENPSMKTATKNDSFFDNPIVWYVGAIIASAVFVGLVVSTVIKYRRNRKVSSQERIRKLLAKMEKSDHIVAASFLQNCDGDNEDDGSFRSSYVNWKSVPDDNSFRSSDMSWKSAP